MEKSKASLHHEREDMFFLAAVHACSTCLRAKWKRLVELMALKPRWVHPLNFREQDKQLLDASLETAEKERIDFTSLCRRALEEYS